MSKIKILILIIVASLFMNCANEKIKIDFEDKNNLPSKIIFNEEYYENTNNLFFLISDYQQNYSKLVEYNLESKEIISIIKEINDENSYIKEFDNDGNYITFSVIDSKNELEQEIYYYNILNNELLKIGNYTITDYPGLYPIRLKIHNNQIVWVEHDFVNQNSYIKLFDIENKEMKIIDSEKFTTSGFKVSIFFVEFKDGLIFYDKNIDNQALKIYCYDTSSNSIIDKYDVSEGTKLHFNGSYNSSKNYLALYAKTSQEDLIYKLYLNSKEIQKLAGFHENSLVYDDIIESENNKIYYSVQLNISGMVKDHYYSEIYNLTNYKMDQIKTAFHIIKSENYLGLLKFDEELNIQKILFELQKQ